VAKLPVIVLEQVPVPNEQSINDPMEFVIVFVQVPLDLQFKVGSSDVASPAAGIFVSLLIHVGALVQSI
jgi:hypothetical protein